LKDAKLADLSVEQAKKFELVTNLDTSQADWGDESAKCAGTGG
jgi:hypothetical protein